MNKVALAIFAKWISGGYDVHSRLPQRQKRRWLKSLLWFLTPPVYGLQGIWRRKVKRFWKWLAYVPSHQECPDFDDLLEMLHRIEQGKHPLFDNMEYPSVDTLEPPEDHHKGGTTPMSTRSEQNPVSGWPAPSSCTTL